MQRGKRQCLHDRPQLVGRAEGVARALHEQHRKFDLRQMLRAQVFRLAGRMQRIAEKHQAAHVARTDGRDLRGDAPAHRFAADRELVARVRTQALDHGPIAGFELAVRIGNAAALFRVGEIERDGIDPARGKPGREAYHEIASLAGAGAVREDERNAHVRRPSRIDERAHPLGMSQRRAQRY